MIVLHFFAFNNIASHIVVLLFLISYRFYMIIYTALPFVNLFLKIFFFLFLLGQYRPDPPYATVSYFKEPYLC